MKMKRIVDCINSLLINIKCIVSYAIVSKSVQDNQTDKKNKILLSLYIDWIVE